MKDPVRKGLSRIPRRAASQTPSPTSPVISSTRSPSPLNQHTSPSAGKSREQKHQPLDGTAESVDVDLEHQFQKVSGDNDASPGVRYITESLIKRLSKQENWTCIRSLNLSSPKNGDKKFKYIENFEKCYKLEILNLGNNQIEKIEKLHALLKLRELDLSCNKISKIEGIEHMQDLQELNLAGNEIEHIPVWVGKKLRSLHVLNLEHNKISSLHDIAKLKPLQDLTSLFLAGNPVVSLPHYRLCTIFHLRMLENLDGQPVTNQERQEALERFNNSEEREKLERELEKAQKELENLKLNHAKALEQLCHKDEVIKSLEEKSLQQKQTCETLQMSLDIKSELLTRNTEGLTRLCQKQYELEQEVAFCKIEAQFEPFNYVLSEDVDLDTPDESPYLGKARYKRNTQLPRPHEKLDSKEKEILSAQRRLEELHSEIENAEQQVLKARGVLQQQEDALAEKKVSRDKKANIEQQMHEKIQIVFQLHKEALELEEEIEEQKIKVWRKQEELEDLQNYLASEDAPRKARKTSKEQQLARMNDHCRELEIRLDGVLFRIAKETEEIKDLEQQLTDGQIATNEAMKRDLESIIAGLQEYLGSVKCQAKRAEDECKLLQKDKESLLQRVAVLEEERNNLQIVAKDAENMQKEIAMLEGALQEQQEINKSLREAQGNISAYEAELEAQLRDRDAEANQHKEELERLKQMELSALQAELEKERKALENALTRAQLAEEKEQQNSKLLCQIEQLQGDNNFLKQQLKDLQNQLNHGLANLLHPEEVLTCVHELKQKLQTGAGEIKCQNTGDVLGKKLATLQKAFNDILTDAQREKEKALAREKQLQEEMVSQKRKLEEVQEKYRQVEAQKRQKKKEVYQLENEIQSLCKKIESMEEIQSLADRQLKKEREEKEAMLAELQDLVKKKQIEETRAQMQFASLNKEIKQLKRTVITSDKLAATELSIARDELKALHGTVLGINQERAEEIELAEEVRVKADHAAWDLARAEAEIELLKQLLKEKEEQFQHDMEKAGKKAVAAGSQKFAIDKLKEAVEQQKAEFNHLKLLLDNIREDKRDEIAALKNALSHQNDCSTRVVDPLKRRGYWYYMPSPQVSTPASRHTKDCSGCLPCSGTFPQGRGGGQDRQCRKEELCHQGGCWVDSPLRTMLNKTNSSKDGRAKEDHEGSGKTHVPEDTPFVPPPGRVIYKVFPDGAPVPQGTVVYGPPPAAASGDSVAPGSVICGPPPVGAQVTYGPLPPKFTVPLIPPRVLHCNVPEHHNLEHNISKLEDTVSYLKKYKDKISEAAKHKCKKEMKKLCRNAEFLHEQQELGHEEVKLQQAVQNQKQHKDFIEGYTDNLTAEMQVEKSLKLHEDIADEIQCIEKTLLKRRAELREADRLLSEAEVALKSTQGKTKDTIQKYNHAKQCLSLTEAEAKKLERKGQNMATELVKADQQFRLLQAGTRDLEQLKRQQEGNLKKINEMMAARYSEFRSLNQNVEVLTESLQKLQGDIKIAQNNEKHHLQILQEAESIRQGKKTELETLKDQIITQQEELLLVEQQLSHRKEELHILQDYISQKKVYLQETLQDGENETNEKLHQLKELKLLLEDLNAEKKRLDAQINEKRTQLSLIKKDVANEEENRQEILGQIAKHKTDLKRVLEMLELENTKYQSLVLQHDQKVNELEKTQHATLQEPNHDNPRLKSERATTTEQLAHNTHRQGKHLPRDLTQAQQDCKAARSSRVQDEQCRGEALQENLQHHADQLKAWLQQCVSKKAEVLIRGKKETEGPRRRWKRQVHSADDFSSATSAPPFLAKSSSLTSLQDTLNLSRTQAALTRLLRVPSCPSVAPQRRRSCSQGISR